MRSALGAATAGHGSVLVVSGEQGVGKSRLLREVRGWCLEAGAGVLVGRAADTAIAVPFRPITEALLGAYRRGSVDQDPDVAPFRGALARLVPDATGRMGEAAGSLLHVAEGFLRVARSSGRGSGYAAVLLDDLHWADAETMAVLEYLADNVTTEPLLVVAAARAAANDAVALLTRMIDRRVATALPLRRLSIEHTAVMTRSCLGDAAIPAPVLQLIADRADGLPFFIEELLAGLRFDGALVRDDGRWIVDQTWKNLPPPTFRESVRVRMALLAAEHQEMLRDAALLGRRIDAHLLAGVMGADPASIAAAVRAASELTLVESYGLGVRFRHALTRDALLADMPLTERAGRSRTVLAALQAARPDLPGDLIEVAADLAEAAGDRFAAVELHLGSARRALARGALTTAESAQRHALALADDLTRIEVTVALVTTLGLAGRAEDTIELGEDLLARLAGEPTADPDGSRRNALHLALARAGAATTDWTLATHHLRAARVRGTDLDGIARLDALAAQVALGENRHDDAARLAASAVAAAQQVGDPDLLCESLLVNGRCLRIRGMKQAAGAFRRAAETAKGAALAHREARALTELGFILSYNGDSAVLKSARERAQSCGAVETEAVAENALAAAAWFRADVDAIAAHTDAGLVLARRFRLGQLEPALLVCKAAGLALRGDTAAMETLLAQAAAMGSEPMEVVAALAQGRAACAFATNDLPTAATHLAAAAAAADAHPTTAVAPMLALLPLLRAAEGTEPPPIAAGLRRWNEGASRMLDGVFAAADAVRAGRDDPRSATTLIERARADLDATPFMAADTLRIAATAAAADHWGEPASWLDQARTTFERLGLPAAAAGCAATLRRLGPRSSALTRREEEVLALIKDGLPNRQIAQRLVLSTRTVEKHVERLLAKTGQTNRAQLATYAVRQHGTA